MSACAACGQENPDGFRFCGSCGAELVAEPAPREVRKTVTVLFCDLAGYTSRGESLDPEALRRVQSRYFDDARAALERHGGSVEKFIGDAVMAVFGIPQVHEDDALRALRAAVDLRGAIAGLGLEARIGVNTGEVVAGSGDALVTGDAVNVAARLEQAAPPGEVLIGEQTYALCRDAVSVEPVEPLAAKGKSEPVGAWRLLEVLPDAPAFERRLDAPMVGRRDELAQLRQAYARAVRERRCHLFTVLGPAGVGKSRLANELVSEMGTEATVLSGRCLSYGEGITYWPLVEIFRGAGAEGRLTEALAAATAEETFLAVRRFLEELARERPLVCVLDDLHWAEPTFLDLVEHVADWSRDAPLLLLCLARPELLEARPSWGGGKVNATTTLLEALTEPECDALIDELLVARLPQEIRRRIIETADGNPLYVEQMLALILEGDDRTEVTVPPTIHALIAARLDALPTEEREIIERASVVGREFDRTSVGELVGDALEPALGSSLLGLIRKELIAPLANGEDFRFAHQLVRDAAYEAMPKELRAELHERFGEYLEGLADIPEPDELVGYHFEQAYAYEAELGMPDDELARRAAARLADAGRRARGRDDSPAAANLMERAAAMLPAVDPVRLELLPMLAEALARSGLFERAEDVIAEALELARAHGDHRVAARAEIVRANVVALTTPTRHQLNELLETAERVIAILDPLGDDRGLAQAWHLLGLARSWRGSADGAGQAFRRALEHARLAEDVGLALDCLGWLGLSYWWGSMPAENGIAECRGLRDQARSEFGHELPLGLMPLGVLLGMRGKADEGRAAIAEGRAIWLERGARLMWATTGMPAGELELVSGEARAAEQVLGESCQVLEEIGAHGYLSSSAWRLAEALYDQGRFDAAFEATALSERHSAQDDFEPQAGWRAARAKVLAERGRLEEAEGLAREALALVGGTDWLSLQAGIWASLARVLELAGRADESRAALERAIAIWEEKGNVVSAAALRAKLTELQPG